MAIGHMARALALARRALGSTSPNPPVGALLVKDGRVVGEGFTQPRGQAHAEIVALAQAGEHAKGASLYTTLEPCSHWGRTPPCTEALIAAGVRDVHMALRDPNPRVNGRGVQVLQDHGVRVRTGECSAEAAELIEAHTKYTQEGRPFVTLLLSPPSDVASLMERSVDVVLTDAPHQLGELRTAVQHLPAALYVVDRGRHLGALNTHLGKTSEEVFELDRLRVLSLPCEADQTDLQGLLSQLAQYEVTSCLFTGRPTLEQMAMRQGIIDKIVAGRGTAIPDGFSVEREITAPSPHLTLYPTGTLTSSNTSTESAEV